MKILYFSWVRDAVGKHEENVAPPAAVVTVEDMIAFLVAQSDGHARAFADPSRLRCAVDLVMVGFDAPIANAAEIAFFPPVTGG